MVLGEKRADRAATSDCRARASSPMRSEYSASASLRSLVPSVTWTIRRPSVATRSLGMRLRIQKTPVLGCL